MFKNSKKQGDAGLGQAIAYFTLQGYNVALPLTDSADWDLIVEIDDSLKRVQVKTSSQLKKSNTEIMIFNCSVKGGNRSFNKPAKTIQEQHWDYIFLYHLLTGKKALIPKDVLQNTKDQINLGDKKSKYNEFIING